MSFKLQVKLTGQSVFTDISSFVYADGSGPVAHKTFALNSLQSLSFSLKEASGFPSIDRGNEVWLDCTTYSPSGELFTGFIAGDPEKDIFAQETDGVVRYVWKVSCVSEEYLCNLAAPLYISTLAAFQNQTVGQIITYLLGILAPGRFDVSGIQQGPVIPYYLPQPGDDFTAIVKSLVESSGMKFWTRRKKAFLSYLNDTALGINSQTTDSFFNPGDITVVPNTQPVYNDVIGYGTQEPQVFVREYFVGDGITMQFPLHLPVYGLNTADILKDDLNSNQVDTSKWALTDPTSAMAFGTSLYVNGGAGINLTKLVALQGIELAGTRRIEHAAIRFTGASSGIIGGLHNSPTAHTVASCVMGFKLSVSGAQTTIQPIVNGALTGTAITTTGGQDYIFETQFQAPERVRRIANYSGFQTPSGFGGVDVGSSVYVSLRALAISEADMTLAPTAFELFNGTLTGSQTFLTYCPFNAANLQMAANFLEVSAPIDVLALTLPSGSATWRTFSIGNDKSIDTDATIVGANNSNSVGSFGIFGFIAPSAGDMVEVRYRSSGQMVSRVTNPSSIAAEAAKTGDSGIRAGILPQLQFAPRCQAELEFAIKAYMDDRAGAVFQGDMKAHTIQQTPPYEPTPGRTFTVNLTGGYSSFQAFATEVDTDIVVESTSPSGLEVMDISVKYGNLDKFNALMLELSQQDAGTTDMISIRSTTVPASTDFSLVGNSFAPNIPDFAYTYTRTPTSYQVDFGTAPPTGAAGDAGHFEVRYSDQNWSVPGTSNLIGETSSRLMTLNRNSRTQQYFARAVIPINFATHSNFEDGLVYVSASGANPPTASFDGSRGGTSFGTQKIVFPAGSAACSGSFTNTVVGALAAGVTLGGRVRVSFSRQLTGAEDVRFKFAGTFNPTAETVLNAANVTSANFSAWQEFVMGPTTGAPTGAPLASINFYVKSALGSALTGWVDSVQIEKNPPASGPTKYYRTTVLPKGPSSRYSSLVQMNFPLPAAAPTAFTADIGNRLRPAFTAGLPSSYFDVFGIQVRDQDNATVLYMFEDPALGLNQTDPALTYVFDNTTLLTRSRTLFSYFYNLLGEASAATSGAFSIPALAVTGLTLDEVDQSVRWGVDPAQSYIYETTVTASSDFSAVTASGTGSGGRFAVNITDVIIPRWYRVRGNDGLGYGALASGSHVYACTGVASFDNTNNVKSVPSPSAPAIDPVIPSPFRNYAPQMTNESWIIYMKETMRLIR